ncbi:bifunctional heparan sulfate N-deacetylase/N-sulfotransferase-like isoform X2 [Limulus polyphemus]|uniref:[heparan sulfate]-glucosamine N-sulfotransferase n=1 Tax=Limulus polyphemus TaxID=6850 RepID=A0ABM1SGR1_LIMPO|nr:bifunctional heparan sulfate N-deacetylase/N-sulfotransferase-like isoform X2 [Limulus polyphemus]
MVAEPTITKKTLLGVCCSVTQPAIRRCLMAAVMFCVISLLVFSYYISNSELHRLNPDPPQPSFQCYSQSSDLLNNFHGSSQLNVHASSARLRLDPKVLVIIESQYSLLGKQISEILEASRTRFKIEIAGKNLPVLTRQDKGKFAVVVFEDYEKYLFMNKWNRELLDKYCLEYGVGVIGFLRPKEKPLVHTEIHNDFDLAISTNLKLYDYHLNPNSSVLRLTRPEETFYGDLPTSDWTVFHSAHSTYKPIAWARAHNLTGKPASENQLMPTLVEDQGQIDGIQRVLFGGGFKFWLHKLLFLDSISFLSHGKLSLPLDRFILIDIDDIFVGQKGVRMKPSDVQALLEAQERLSHSIQGFRFNLGFSGKFFHHGSGEENKGDDMLLKYVDSFWWFPHMWGHMKPHLFYNHSLLDQRMLRNYQFAKQHGIPVNSGYSVAPHHSGVYPVHEQLYEAWKKVWNVRVTSTEEYPHLHPARFRRGFVHRNIMVLPRQTCGLYTHTIFLNKYPGGPARLKNSIYGGDLFSLFVYNPINVFMTHLSNYGNDRLAPYTFESVVKFVKCWTNLRLFTVPPLKLAEKYFELYPEETDPVWINPCIDKRHKSIWSKTKTCDQLPKFLVIGPQKTGTTALYTFLTMHPAIVSNYPSPETYEEVQFFNGKNYYKGLDWYMNFFPVLKNSSSLFLFEKSATYFDGELVPMRVNSLLPYAKLVTILISPIKRAYSWYQHMRAHKDPIALRYTFYDIVTANETFPKSVRELRNRCLNPGHYAQHLERWLSYFHPRQLLIIDGEELKDDPASVMSRFQRFLRIKPFFSYRNRLKYNPSKGFFCPVTEENSVKCLGHNKGRNYPPMDYRAEKFLSTFYLPHNVALSKLLNKLRQPIPEWLERDLSRG